MGGMGGGVGKGGGRGGGINTLVRYVMHEIVFLPTMQLTTIFQNN